MAQKDINIKNRRATFDYEIVETFTAGIVLTGTEIKSIRTGHASLVDTFCYVSATGEIWGEEYEHSHIFLRLVITSRGPARPQAPAQ